jgi:cytochrome c553
MDWIVIVAALATLGGCGDYSAAVPQAFTASGEIIALGGGKSGVRHACMTCHGLQGQGDSHLAPRLAGLDRGYLHRQLNDYADGRRHHDDMQRIAHSLSGEDRAKVSQYYAALSLQNAPQADQANEAGARLYRAGDAARGLVPCASCHGENGQGEGAANPPLSQQPAAYLAVQLRAWKRGERQNDPGRIMQRISQSLADDEIMAVSLFAAALPGGSLSLPQAASQSGHRAGPRNDASEQRLHVPGSEPAAE